MNKKIFIAAAVMISSQLSAQDSTRALDQVVVTASKFPIKQSLIGKDVTVIGRRELEKSSGKTLSEVLNTQAGIFINGSSNTRGTNQDLYLRGAAAGKTLILLDGIPLYDASGISGAFDINMISPDMIERIEILKGNQSSLYGSDAIAGVINIITRKSSGKKIEPSLQLAAGSYQSFKGTAGLSGSVKKSSYNVQVSQEHSKGFSSAADPSGVAGFDKDGFGQTIARAHFNQRFSERFSMNLVSQYSRYQTDADAGAFTDDKDYTITNRNALAGIGAQYSIKKTKLYFNYNYNTTERKYLDDSTDVGGFARYSEGKYVGRSHFAELYSNLALASKVDLLVGADYRQQVTDQHYLSISSYGPYETGLGDTSKVNQLGVYASLFLKNLSRFNLELGSRYNHFSKYGDVGTFTVNPSYLVTDQVKLFANLATGFKAPSLYQLYSEYRNPTTDLKPERSVSLEGGVRYSKINVDLKAVYFLRNIKDNIVFFSEGAPNYLSYYVNADRQKDKGLELEASLRFEQISFQANYTNLDGRLETTTGNKDTSFFNLFRRPRQTINMTVGLEVCPQWTISLNVQSISKRWEAVYAAPPVELAAYYTWNIYTDYRVGKKIKLFADLKNITGEQYVEIRGYNSRRFNFMSGVSIRL